MRRSALIPLIATALLVGGPLAAVAQVDSEPTRRRGAGSGAQATAPRPASPEQPITWARSHLSVWIARSVTPGSVLGSISEGRVAFLGIRYGRVLLPAPSQDPRFYEGPRLTYTVDLIPAARLHVPVEGMPERVYRTETPRPAALTTYGVGAYPVGLRVTFWARSSVRPFLAGQAGALRFADAFPDSRGHRFNFAAALGAGLRTFLSRRTTLILGYRYHHLSNGFRGSINPGLDANVLYLGVGTVL